MNKTYLNELNNITVIYHDKLCEMFKLAKLDVNLERNCLDGYYTESNIVGTIDQKNGN